MRKIKKLAKFAETEVDDHFRLRYFTGPAESGTPLFGVRSMYIWDCKLELNFVPA
jgi:hypothetical protein